MRDTIASGDVMAPMNMREMIYVEADARSLDRNKFLVARVTTQGPLVEAYRNYEAAKRAVFHPASAEVYLMRPGPEQPLLRVRDGVLDRVFDERCYFCGAPAFESIDQSVQQVKRLRNGGIAHSLCLSSAPSDTGLLVPNR